MEFGHYWYHIPWWKRVILVRDNFTCQLCGARPTIQRNGHQFPDLGSGLLHIDHIYPVSKGGETVPSNLRALCARCNLVKGDKIDNQYLVTVKGRQIVMPLEESHR